MGQQFLHTLKDYLIADFRKTPHLLVSMGAALTELLDVGQEWSWRWKGGGGVRWVVAYVPQPCSFYGDWWEHPSGLSLMDACFWEDNSGLHHCLPPGSPTPLLKRSAFPCPASPCGIPTLRWDRSRVPRGKSLIALRERLCLCQPWRDGTGSRGPYAARRGADVHSWEHGSGHWCLDYAAPQTPL